MTKINLKEFFVVQKERLPHVIHTFGREIPSLEAWSIDGGMGDGIEQSGVEDVTAIESQQIDQDINERVNAALQARLDRMEQEMPQGFRGDALNYFVMDPRSLDAEDGREQRALQAMVRGALYDPQRTIAAFIPVLDADAPSKAEQNDGVDSVLRINRHLTDFLAERGVEIINSLEALEAHLEANALPSETTSTESTPVDWSQMDHSNDPNFVPEHFPPTAHTESR